MIPDLYYLCFFAPSDQSSASDTEPEEGEATWQQREQVQAEKQEQLCQKRDQKLQEIQAKRKADASNWTKNSFTGGRPA